MGKKQFDHIENRIREAAENSEPPFDENAWAIMEARLNKEDNKRRRYLLWWIILPFIFIAAGSVYFFFNNKYSQKIAAPVNRQAITESKPSQQKNISVVTESESPSQQKNIPVVTESKSSSQQKIIPVVTESESPSQQKIIPAVTESKLLQSKNIPSATQNKSLPAQTGASVSPSLITNSSAENNGIDFHKKRMSAVYKPGLKISDSNNGVTNGLVNNVSKKIKDSKKARLLVKSNQGEIAAAGKAEPAVDKAGSNQDVTQPNIISDNTVPDILKDSLTKKDTVKIAIANNLPDKKSTGKIKKSTPSRFYFLASLGPDAGSVKLLSFKNSKITAKYGVGIGYQLTKKISIQTGFYASTKKYIAGPGDYNPKAGSYWNMVQIVKVNAACLIYDIPLTVRYDVTQKPSTVFYATSGISSFIMKKENYNYHYFRNAVYNQSSWKYTGNKNLFAVLNFSAGVEKKISPEFFIQAEPSVSIPITGVGDGRVKLYSAALQLSVKYQPHKKHK